MRLGMQAVTNMKTAQDLFGNKRIMLSNSRKSERGEFLKHFAEKTGKPLGYIAYRLTKVPTSDFYFIQKQCDEYKGPWAKAFFGMLKPTNEFRSPSTTK